jgi:two-component system, response regulator
MGLPTRDFGITCSCMQPVVLHVEDNDDDAELVAIAWRAAKLTPQMIRVRDGLEALEFLFAREPTDHPTLVLLDWELPAVSGREVLAKIRENHRTRQLPVVVFTSSDREEDCNSAKRLRANDFVRKPAAYSEFADAAEQIGRLWLDRNARRARE